MTKAIILSRVNTQQQNLEQQTQEVLREVYKDGFKSKDIIILEDKELFINLSEEERNGLNRMKFLIESDSRRTARIKIFNKINDEVDFYEIDCWKHTWKEIGLCRKKELKDPIKTDFLLI